MTDKKTLQDQIVKLRLRNRKLALTVSEQIMKIAELERANHVLEEALKDTEIGREWPENRKG